MDYKYMLKRLIKKITVMCEVVFLHMTFYFVTILQWVFDSPRRKFFQRGKEKE